MIVFILLVGACLIIGAILAVIVFHFVVHKDRVCYACDRLGEESGEPAWVWLIDGEEQLICDWHNSLLQMEYRGSRPERRLGDAPQS